jgi:hypothetical protein
MIGVQTQFGIRLEGLRFNTLNTTVLHFRNTTHSVYCEREEDKRVEKYSPCTAIDSNSSDSVQYWHSNGFQSFDQEDVPEMCATQEFPTVLRYHRVAESRKLCIKTWPKSISQFHPLFLVSPPRKTCFSTHPHQKHLNRRVTMMIHIPMRTRSPLQTINFGNCIISQKPSPYPPHLSKHHATYE